MAFAEEYYESEDLNWNDLTNSQQKFLENRLISSEVLTRCNQLIEDAQKEEYIEFTNLWHDPAPEGDEEEMKEIFQYFIVTEWLSSQIEAVEGCVAEYKGLHIWGRTDYGSGLVQNHTLKEVARNFKPMKISL